jgi:leucyl/phenylalanyl-tRNA--protein transferase
MGGDLSPSRLLLAYSQGIFPWYQENYPILWWSPDPRLILFPQQFKLTRSLNKTLRKPFSFSRDTAFAEVINACSSASGRIHQTWITPEMIEAYLLLHKLGYAHSIEVWFEGELAGGLYGISLGRAFFGESMFHHVRDASKLALYYLCETLKTLQFDFIDCQLPTEHLQNLGAQIIPRNEFLNKLYTSLKHPNLIGSWTKI